MSIKNKILLGLVFSAVMPLALVAITVFPFHRHYLEDREATLLGAAAQNRATRAAASLRSESDETLEQIAAQIPNLGTTPEVLIFSKDRSGRFAPVTTPRYEATRSNPYEDLQPFLAATFQDSDPHHATLPDQRGVMTVMVARRVLGDDYAVVVKKDLAEILQPNAVLRDYFLVLSFIAIALAALAALMLTRTVTGPLLTLSRTVATFDTDDPERIEAAGHDEVATLARSFREMWERIQDYNRDLEDKVQKRTAELAEANRTVEAANAALTNRLAEIERLSSQMVGRDQDLDAMKGEMKKLKKDGGKK